MPSDASAERLSPPKQRAGWPVFVVGYVALVLAWDTLRVQHPELAILRPLYTAAPWLFSQQGWTGAEFIHWLARHQASSALLSGARILSGFDAFKFLFWFVVPLLLCGRGVDWSAFGTRLWRRFDWGLFAVASLLGFLAVCSVPFIPGMGDFYRTAGMGVPLSAKLLSAAQSIVWTLSWLTGWEFMHRYFLLRAAASRWPRWGWLLPPFMEWAYHLQKHWLEGLGMLLFSLLASQYVLRRRNVALPFYVHLFIEIALPLSLLFASLNPLVWAMGRH